MRGAKVSAPLLRRDGSQCTALYEGCSAYVIPLWEGLIDFAIPLRNDALGFAIILKFVVMIKKEYSNLHLTQNDCIAI